MIIHTVNMSEQERLLKEINLLSNSIRRKNRALRLGINERDKYLETTFKPVVDPIKEMMQTVKKIIPTTESDLLLPVNKFEKKEDNDEDNNSYAESQDLSEEPGITETNEEEDKKNIEKEKDVFKSDTVGKSDEEEEEKNENEPTHPSNISKLGQDIPLMGVLGRKYLLKMLHSTPTTRKYHVYGARIEGTGVMIGNKTLDVDKDDNIFVGDKGFKGTKGLFELVFKTKPENYTRTDLKTFKQICQLSNTHRKSYLSTGAIHKNTSLKYKNIILQLFPPKRIPLKRKAMSTGEINLLHKKRKTLKGQGLLKDMYSTNIIYYTDVNKLVTRMRLLYEAMEAGHTGLENEWIALTTEIKNRGVIE